MARLKKMLDLIRDRADEIVDAVVGDYVSRSRHETLLAEIFTTVSGIRHIQKHLKSWMVPQKRTVSSLFQLAKARVLIQPLGVVGVISPWNYPFYLAMMPVVTALAAGNRVMLKPSKFTPRTGEAMAGLIAAAFPKEVAHVVRGGPGVGSTFASLPFDHILFTGSPGVGREVMAAASQNLTPVTLELGGKSPVIISEDFDMARAAELVCAGKFFNAGQTCIAPDYVLLPAGSAGLFVDRMQKTIAGFYPTLAHNPDYTAIINDRHFARLSKVLAEAKEKGAEIITVNPAGEKLEPAARKLAPAIVLNASGDTALMTDEIFGPILPVVTYKTLAEALAYVNKRPRPLALYVMDDNAARANYVLSRTTSGGACVNATLLHVAQDDLPFGGVGNSGMGRYHSREGFETLSNIRGVFYQGRLNGQSLLRPPYTKLTEKITRFLIGG
jgi:coniferyl-aldehyde dehydrogenase